MKKTYEKPTIILSEQSAEGVFLASGAGNVDVKYANVWDRWNNGGKACWNISWSGIKGTLQVTMEFNQPIDQVETTDASVEHSVSGSTATFTIGSGVSSPLTVGVHLNREGASIDNLQMTNFSYKCS